MSLSPQACHPITQKMTHYSSALSELSPHSSLNTSSSGMRIRWYFTRGITRFNARVFRCYQRWKLARARQTLSSCALFLDAKSSPRSRGRASGVRTRTRQPSTRARTRWHLSSFLGVAARRLSLVASIICLSPRPQSARVRCAFCGVTRTRSARTFTLPFTRSRLCALVTTSSLARARARARARIDAHQKGRKALRAALSLNFERSS